MRQFYLSKNNHGYYRVVFVDPETGWQSIGKSTHTKNQFEAYAIATTWLKEGVPEGRSNSRTFNNSVKGSVKKNLKSIVDTLTFEEASKLLELISAKFGSASPVISKAPVINTAAVVKPENALVSEIAESAPVMKELSANAPVPRAKKRCVVKKTPMSEPVLVNADKSVVRAGASTVPSVGVTAEGKHLLCETMDHFWDYENSEFIKRSLAHGHSISKKHAFCMRAYVRNYWEPYFGNDALIEDLELSELDDFFFFLHDEKELAGETVNKNINMANKCFKTLLAQKKIAVNPLEGIERFKADNEERGIPTEEEVRQLLELDWENEAAKLAFKVAAFYGLRAGEISGLRVCDIDVVSDFIHVRHSYSEVDKLKSTKNKDTRDLPVNHSLALQLMNHARQNPAFGDLSYVFWSVKDFSIPITPGYYADCLYKALEQIGVSKAEREERNIVFHSLRHFCCTVLKQRADTDTVMAIMGHRSYVMTEHYSDHDTQEKFNNMRNVISGAWEKYLSA